MHRLRFDDVSEVLDGLGHRLGFLKKLWFLSDAEETPRLDFPAIQKSVGPVRWHVFEGQWGD